MIAESTLALANATMTSFLRIRLNILHKEDKE